MKDTPPIIKEIGFDFHWSEEKVWKLDAPVSDMEIGELLWHFDIPFLDDGYKCYALTPRAVMEYPERYQKEYARMQRADRKWPLDIMENKGRWLLLDGLHRLMQAYILGEQKIKVRIIPRERIPEITR